MRDVDISEIETDDVEGWLMAYLKGTLMQAQISWERTDPESGVVVFEVILSGLRERFTFTEL